MSAAVISTLIFASPGASAFSGSRTDPDSLQSSGREVSGRLATNPGADPSADYWHGLAVKRLHLLGKRERRIVALLVRIHKLRADPLHGKRTAGAGRSSANSVRSTICSVFGAHCSEAISVATCESTLRVTARNGDYWGLFQFGSFARAHYGFAWDALTQSRAAYRYWRDAGWSPWQCQP